MNHIKRNNDGSFSTSVVINYEAEDIYRLRIKDSSKTYYEQADFKTEQERDDFIESHKRKAVKKSTKLFKG